MDTVKIAAAFRALADAFDGAGGVVAGVPVTGGVTAKPRGRPPKGETVTVTTPTVVAAAETPDPFAETAAPAPPVATLDEVRAALTALRSATDQATALKVLKAASGADNLTALTADKYGAVVAAAQAAFPAAVLAVAEPDPFATPAAEPAKVTLEDVRAASVKAQKRTSTDKVASVVMARGGKRADPEGGAMKPSFNALPESEYAATIKELGELPSTK